MIYIYNDYGGTHTTSLAAAFHLNILKPSQQPLSKKEILAVPYFNKLTRKDFGKLIFHGKDEEGHPVYTLGRKKSKLVVPALKEWSQMFMALHQVEEKIIFSNTSPTVPFVMTIGGGLSRGLGIDSLGVPLLIKGAQKCSGNIHQLVEYTKNIATEQTSENVIILENKQFKA
ncbi:ABC transporter [Thalassobacillus devorans]|uniref:ABC transporter n=1 Tax=Thalassobacillus devorans TaxID=279813 RepID=A0ABQ1NJP5_9BACI|nr:DUF3189 family protein [Thalassobacillus devorans]NIK27595.1 hypothetical protein [Thalassobacillus devorans]GGC78951.1 ABC transporter [Thalassobacillus devorans]